MLISPTEPKELRALGRTSVVPERYGADFLWASPIGLVGVQRKELQDLVASLHDGRLGKELGQMERLDLAVLIIEGTPQWSTDGFLLNVRSFTLDQLNGVLFSIQAQGVWYLPTTSIIQCARLLKSLETWLLKNRHGMIRSRPKASGEWGTANNREWGVHLLQSFPGIGVEVAGRIYDHFDGVPMRWTVGEGELRMVTGVGGTRAEKMLEALNGTKS